MTIFNLGSINIDRVYALDHVVAPGETESAVALAEHRRTIRANPGEVALLAIGPLTNVATLFSLDPEIPTLLKGLYLMCGRFFDSMGGVFHPEVCAYEDDFVRVPLAEPTAGWTVRAWPPPGEPRPHRLARTVDPDAFFRFWFGALA